MKLWIACGALALGVSLVFGNSSADAQELKAGDPAPQFKLQGSDGKTYELSQFAGKKVVVIAWFPKAFTGGCTKECKSFKEQGEAMRNYEVAYFTASCDTPELNTKFAESLGLDYPILSDPSREVAKAFGVLPEGKMNAARWTYYIGTDGRILHVDKSVQVANHGQDVANRLKELGVKSK